MNINRNNYEEYFLLYVDDELSPQQKQEVEIFVRENADLVAELDMFKNTKLPPAEELAFDKSFLFRNEGSNINLTDYTSFFLLAVDNELNEKEKDELKIFLQQHPELNEELALLYQTVLPVEEIAFPDKSVLYKSEKERRVAPFGWLRLAVAAAFIGLAFFVWKIIPSEKQQQIAVADKNIISPKKEITPALTPQLKINEVDKNNISAATNDVNKNNQTKNIAAKNHTSTNQPINNKNYITAVKDNGVNKNEPASQSPANTTQPQVAAVSNNLPQRETNVEPPVITDQTPQPEKTTEQNQQNVYTANTSNSNAISQPAVYHELNTSDEDSKSLYLGSVEINKNKLRGLFKKASHLFGGKTKDNENAKDVKVASLDINTQNL